MKGGFSMKYLVYSRPRTHSFFRFLLEELCGSKDEIVFISDWKIKLGIDIHRRALQVTNGFSREDIKFLTWSESELNDIILRDRFLRGVTNEKLIANLIFGYTAVLSEIIQYIKPDAIFSIPMDCYIVDLLERLARRNRIPFWQFVGSPIKARTRLTRRGELVKFVDNEEEIQTVTNRYIDKIRSGNYFPDYVSSRRNNIFNISRIIFKDLIKRSVFSILERLRPYQFNYVSVLKSNNTMYAGNFQNLFLNKFFNEELPDSPYVYIPLQWYPETSIDYFSTTTNFLPYYDWLFKIITLVSKNSTVVLKEHPVALGYRPLAIYKKLTDYNRVFLLPPHYPSKTIIENSVATITHGTTTSIESIILRRPSITLGKPYFDFKDLFVKIQDSKDLKDFNEIIEKCKNKVIEERDIRNFVKNYVSCTIRGYSFFVDFDSKNSEMRKNVQNLKKSLRKYKSLIFGY